MHDNKSQTKAGSAGTIHRVYERMSSPTRKREPVKTDQYWMRYALKEAKKAAEIGEVPIGAIIVRDGKIIARGYNLRESKKDPTGHAEMIAIRKASTKIGGWRLTGATMYVTLEPCIMCMGAILLSRLDRVVFGCLDPKAGAAGSIYDLSCDARLNHRVEVTVGVNGEECSKILSEFFLQLRKRKRSERGPEPKVADGSTTNSTFK